jgi:hypothetical protein
MRSALKIPPRTTSIPSPAGRNSKKTSGRPKKMIKVYGAPIDDADAAKIVDYLAATY